MILLRFYKLFVKSGKTLQPFMSQNVWFFMCFISKNGNLCYHGTGSEESAREGVHGHQEEEVA